MKINRIDSHYNTRRHLCQEWNLKNIKTYMHTRYQYNHFERLLLMSYWSTKTNTLNIITAAIQKKLHSSALITLSISQVICERRQCRSFDRALRELRQEWSNLKELYSEIIGTWNAVPTKLIDLLSTRCKAMIGSKRIPVKY